jgi:hypothetical protein
MLLIVSGAASRSATAAEAPPPSPRKFTAQAEFSKPGVGIRTIQVGIIISHLTQQQEAESFKKTLEQESLEYPFAVLVFDVDGDGRGEGEHYQTAALSVDGSGYVEVKNYGGRAGRLTDIEPPR